MKFSFPLVILIRTIIIVTSIFLLLVAEGTSHGTDVAGRSVGVLCSIIACAIMFFFLFSNPSTSFRPPNLAKHRKPIAWALIILGSVSVFLGYYSHSLSDKEVGPDYYSALSVLGGCLVLLSGTEVLKNTDRSNEIATLLGFLFVFSGGTNILIGIYLWWVFLPRKNRSESIT